jgi:hypothetical protein
VEVVYWSFACERNEGVRSPVIYHNRINKYQFCNLLHFLVKSIDICLKIVSCLKLQKNSGRLDVVASIPVSYAGRHCLECGDGHWFYVQRYDMREGTQLLYSY